MQLQALDWIVIAVSLAVCFLPALSFGKRSGKNTTDGVDSTPYVPLRHLIALIYPITATIRPFLVKAGATDDRLDAMHEAWRKSVVMQVALWARPYVADSW